MLRNRKSVANPDPLSNFMHGRAGAQGATLAEEGPSIEIDNLEGSELNNRCHDINVLLCNRSDTVHLNSSWGMDLMSEKSTYQYYDKFRK